MVQDGLGLFSSMVRSLSSSAFISSRSSLAMTSDSNVVLHQQMRENLIKPNERIHMVKGEHGKEHFTLPLVRHPFVCLVTAYQKNLENLTE